MESIVHKAANIGRAVLLVMFCFFVAVFVIWSAAPHWVNYIDNLIIAKYTEKYDERLENAKRAIQHERAEAGVDLLIDLINDLNKIQKLDRLDPVKRRAFDQLIQVLKRQNRLESALYWAEKWIDFDNKDLFALTQRTKVLYSITERRDEAKRLISDLRKQLPESRVVFDTYYQILLKEKRIAEAFLAFLEFSEIRESSKISAWIITMDVGNGFDDGRRQEILPYLLRGKKMELSFDLEAGVRQLRFEPSLQSYQSLECPELFFQQHNGRNTRVELKSLPIDYHNMEFEYNALKVFSDGDAHFTWQVPEKWQEVRLTITLTAGLTHPYPEYIIRLLTSPDAQELEKSLLTMGEEEAVNQLAKMRKDISGSSETNLFPRPLGEIVF